MPSSHGPDAPHAERAREILAEDIRFLFGGSLATASGVIENPSLATPDQVDGLQAFLNEALSGGPAVGATLACTAYPNPCNPLTTVAMSLPADAAGDARRRAADRLRSAGAGRPHGARRRDPQRSPAGFLGRSRRRRPSCGVRPLRLRADLATDRGTRHRHRRALSARGRGRPGGDDRGPGADLPDLPVRRLSPSPRRRTLIR